MTKIFILLIEDIINGIMDYFSNNLLLNLVDIALHAEKHMTNMGISGFKNLFNIFVSFGITLIVLKFLKKGFDIYVLWSDGDADSEPSLLLTNFLKAMVVALTFPIMYSWLAKIIEDLTNRSINALGLSTNTDISLLEYIISGKSLFQAIAYLIFFIFLVILYVQFIKQGLSIMILRIGLPLACVGLMDANKGVFNTYIQKLFQLTLSVMVQVLLLKMGLGLMAEGHLIWGIASQYFAIKLPSFLQDILISSGGGGAMNTVHSSARFVQTVKSIVK